MMPLPTTYLRCAFLLSQTTIDKGLVLISSAVGAEDRGGVRSDGRQAAVKVSTSQSSSKVNSKHCTVRLLCSFRQDRLVLLSMR